MIIKLLSTIAVFIHTVHTIPQFGLPGGFLNIPSTIANGSIGSMSTLTKALTSAVSTNPSQLLNVTSSVGKGSALASGVSKVAVDSAQRIAESLKGLIENFTDFKTIFNKTYLSKAEERLRENIFKLNLAFISDHNQLFKKGKESFSVAMNALGDLRRDEYLKLLGVDLSKSPNVFSNNAKNKSRNRRHSRAAGCQFPTEKDWRKDGAVTPVKDQLSTCGSCWAFASTGAFESHYFLKHGKLPNFSEQQLVDCAESEGKGCDGAFMYAAYEYVMKNGIVTNEKYPYQGRESGAQNKCNLRSDVKITNFQPIDQNEAAVKDAVCRFGPVAIVIDAGSEKFWLYHGGIYRNWECSTKPSDGNHAMLIVGYGTDSDTDEPYWIVKNSYGPSWGENGYVRIPRDPNHACGIEKLASFPIF